MHGGNAFLQNLALILCVAAVTTIVFQRLRQPVVFGYLLAGMIVGPHVPLPLFADQEMLRALAELGVVLLMFALGLEFSVRKVVELAPTSGLAALAETSVMLWLGFTVGQLLGWPTLGSLYLGAIVAISSTTIIAKAFSEQGITGGVRGVVFGILIFEDVVAILLVAVLTALSGSAGLSVTTLGTTVIRLAGFLVALVGIGLFLVPRLIRLVLRVGRGETLLVTSIGICFAAALLALYFGYSVALGAFIAGSLVAESGQGPLVARLIHPMRDIFVAIFFVAVGTLIDLRVIVDHGGLVAGLIVLVAAGKVVAVTIAAFLTGNSPRTAVQAGMSLAQIGEFSFIIAAVGASSGAMPAYLYPVAVAVSAITTFTTPWLIRAAEPVALFVDRKLPKPLQTYVSLYGSWMERLRGAGGAPRSTVRRYVRLILLDAALLGLIVVAASLEMERITELLTRLLGVTPRAGRWAMLASTLAVAAPVLYGVVHTARFLANALAVRALPASGQGRVDFAAAPRGTLVVTLQLGIVAAVIVPILAITQPVLPTLQGVFVVLAVLGLLVLAFWRSARNLYGHARAGADIILEAMKNQLAQSEEPFGADRSDAMHRTMEHVRMTLPGLGEPVPVHVGSASPCVNRRLADINLRGLTGATVLAIGRAGGAPVAAPTGHEIVRAGDILIVAGTHEAMDAAVRVLGGTVYEGEPPPAGVHPGAGIA